LGVAATGIGRSARGAVRRYFRWNEPESAVDGASHDQYLSTWHLSGTRPATSHEPAMPLRMTARRSGSMAIVLNHTIVPAKDNRAAARFFADTFGLSYDGSDHGHFAPVRVNSTLTLLFDTEEPFESHHYAFHVSDAEFDAILGRVRRAGISYGSAPWSIADGKLNDWGGGRGVYFKDPNGHILELMTVPQ
jgi:catechol 2,3-dioxygenase-like lactoylglutathione lyase family enzyme